MMIKKQRRRISIIHFINSLSALLTGWILIKNPSGEIFGLSLDWLAATPMKNYAIIGLIWFVFNGLLGLLLGGLTLLKNKYFADLAILQGGLLTGWLLLAFVFVKQIIWFWHVPYLIIALLLVIFGIRALNSERQGL